MLPHQGRTGPASGEIVLLEEAELYRYHSGDGHALPDSGVFLAAVHQTPTPPPPPPAKFARSMRSQRSAATTNYQRHGTPHAARSTKRSASIDTIPAHYGALRAGGPVQLFSRQYSGLLVNWVLIGIFNGAISGLVTPLFSQYLGLTTTQRTATLALFDFGWYFKFLFGFLTDCLPIRRQRRKPYIFIGWAVFLAFMLAMTFMDKVEWYGTDGDVRNADAPSQGRRYIAPILISSFAHLMANVACEGLMVELAHREGEYDRGRTQLWCVSFRFIGETLGGAFAGFGLSSAEYGGTFAHAVPLDVYFATLALLAGVGIVVTYFFLEEERATGTRPSLGSSMRRFWRFIEQRVTLLVMVAVFLLSLALNLPVQEYADIYDVWLETSSLAQSVVSIAASASTILAAALLYKWGLNANWHALVGGGFAVALVLTLPLELLTVWDIVRNSALLLSKDWLAGIFEGVVWLVRLMVIVEVSEPGLESTTYGFLTTVCNLSNMVLTASYNMASATWDAESTDMAADSSRVRWHLTNEFLFKYGARALLTLAGCWLLPRQKRHLKDIKVRGAPNLVLPVAVFVVVAALFVASITSVFLTVFDSTMCLPFAGGTGCDNDSDK